MGEIERYGAIELFPEIPDYAMDVLWIEWQRIKRCNPPDNIICTTLKSYQLFCKLVDDNAFYFPATFVTRQTIQDPGLMEWWTPSSTSPALERKRREDRTIHNSFESWPEDDGTVYVAFIYDGYDRRSLTEAIVDKLRLRGQLHLLTGSTSADRPIG